MPKKPKLKVLEVFPRAHAAALTLANATGRKLYAAASEAVEKGAEKLMPKIGRANR